MKKAIPALFTILMLVLTLSSCKKDVPTISVAQQLELDKTAIRTYLTSHSITATEDANGLFYKVNKEGTGLIPTLESEVEVKLLGTFLSGQSFAVDTTGRWYVVGTAFFPGLQLGITKMKKGGDYTFYIPSGLAFGPYGNYDGTVPPNTNVIFNVRLVDDDAQLIKDVAAIDKYITDNNVQNVVKDPSGLRYVVLDPGIGSVPGTNSAVTTDYKVNILGGKQVDANPSYTFNMSDPIIKGWKIGLTKVKSGGHIALYIPSVLAYGAAGAATSSSSSIPANTNLYSDIKLTFVGN